MIKNNEAALRLKQIICEVLDKEVCIEHDTSLNQIGLNSFRLIEMLTRLEKEFNIELHEDDLMLENFGKFNDVMNLLISKYHVSA